VHFVFVMVNVHRVGRQSSQGLPGMDFHLILMLNQVALDNPNAMRQLNNLSRTTCTCLIRLTKA